MIGAGVRGRHPVSGSLPCRRLRIGGPASKRGPCDESGQQESRPCRCGQSLHRKASLTRAMYPRYLVGSSVFRAKTTPDRPRCLPVLGITEVILSPPISCGQTFTIFSTTDSTSARHCFSLRTIPPKPHHLNIHQRPPKRRRPSGRGRSPSAGSWTFPSPKPEWCC